MNKKTCHFQCTVYLADGVHVSQNEICETAQEAIERANAWTKLGHKAIAHKVVIDYWCGEVRYYPLS